MKPINELLEDPEKLLALSPTELKQLFEPYIPEARKAVLPQEKARKMGVENRAVYDMLKTNSNLLAQVEALRAARKDRK